MGNLAEFVVLSIFIKNTAPQNLLTGGGLRPTRSQTLLRCNGINTAKFHPSQDDMNFIVPGDSFYITFYTMLSLFTQIYLRAQIEEC